jgi:hypothetical protein
VTAEQAVETYARERMARGELLTWRFDAKPQRAVLFVPEDVEIASFPSQIAGVPTRITQLPRPMNFKRSY